MSDYHLEIMDGLDLIRSFLVCRHRWCSCQHARARCRSRPETEMAYVASRLCPRKIGCSLGPLRDLHAVYVRSRSQGHPAVTSVNHFEEAVSTSMNEQK
ncbi:hypothetical protein ACLOJK_010774 [Asimina triloba]